MEDCKHVFKSGKLAGSGCKLNGRHAGYCAKHKKAVVPAAVAAAVGVDEAVGSKPAPKHKFSSFYWTLNSNTSALKIAPGKVGEFKKMVGFIFSDDKVADYLADKMSPNDPRANLDEVKCDYKFEIAPGNKTVHAHGIVKLKHHGHYSLRIAEIREVVAGIMGKKMHLNVKAGGDADRAWEQYMAKNAVA